MLRPILTILAITLSLSVLAQERLRPGQLYKPGDSIWSPRVGVKAVIPQNWNGVLPRDEEIFLLSSTNSFAEIFVMTNENDSFEEMRKRWKVGTEFGGNILVKAAGEPGLRNKETLGADLEVVNSTTPGKGYIEARCSPYNFCLVAFMITDPQNFDANKKGVQQLMDGIQFEKPSNENPYTNFDWDPFLRNKQLVSFSFDNKSSKETLVNLCSDGTFRATFKKSGLFKDQGLKGKKSGTWTVNGIGPTTKLILTITKMGPVETILEIRDEKIFANGERYFVSESVDCK